MERTFVLVKPEGVQRSLTFAVAERFEARGFVLVNVRMIDAPVELARKHCELQGLRGRDLDGAVERLGDGPCVAYAWEAKRAVAAALEVCGDADPMKAKVGTVRGDLALTLARNLVDVAPTAEVAAREIELWFGARD
jgi:nucleoside-diphosphate kinase